MRLKRIVAALLAAVMLFLSGCGAQTVEASETCDTIHVALTFDDGPHETLTPRLLEELAERDVRATFFVIGDLAENNRELLQEMAAAGHQIGNHSYDHAQLDKLSCWEATKDIEKCDTLLQEILGEGIYWVRPPYGSITEGECAAIAAPLITRSVDPEDWKILDAKRVTKAVEENISDGCIILMHDQYPTTVEATLQIIDDLQAQGVVFCTLEELFAVHDIVPELGRFYRHT